MRARGRRGAVPRVCGARGGARRRIRRRGARVRDARRAGARAARGRPPRSRARHRRASPGRARPGRRAAGGARALHRTCLLSHLVGAGERLPGEARPTLRPAWKRSSPRRRTRHSMPCTGRTDSCARCCGCGAISPARSLTAAVPSSWRKSAEVRSPGSRPPRFSAPPSSRPATSPPPRARSSRARAGAREAHRAVVRAAHPGDARGREARRRRPLRSPRAPRRSARVRRAGTGLATQRLRRRAGAGPPPCLGARPGPRRDRERARVRGRPRRRAGRRSLPADGGARARAPR